MKIQTTNYQNYLQQIPEKGRHILAQQTDNKILVYQAFNPNIARYAIDNQRFGGNHYSFNRMTWIKPNFLWMMYRCGWAEKHNQECVLGIWITKSGFETILKEAAYSSYQADIYQTTENWKTDLANKSVRLQWDPDHDIYGAKQERRAIQLGMKGDILKQFNDQMICKIVDMTSFVKNQKLLIDTHQLKQLKVPNENIFKPSDKNLNDFLKLD
ncbi:MAG: DUF4291 domain-containing protein [Saprospiraceae bacterium]